MHCERKRRVGIHQLLERGKATRGNNLREIGQHTAAGFVLEARCDLRSACLQHAKGPLQLTLLFATTLNALEKVLIKLALAALGQDTPQVCASVAEAICPTLELSTASGVSQAIPERTITAFESGWKASSERGCVAIRKEGCNLTCALSGHAQELLGIVLWWSVARGEGRDSRGTTWRGALLVGTDHQVCNTAIRQYVHCGICASPGPVHDALDVVPARVILPEDAFLRRFRASGQTRRRAREGGVANGIMSIQAVYSISTALQKDTLRIAMAVADTHDLGPLNWIREHLDKIAAAVLRHNGRARQSSPACIIAEARPSLGGA